MKNHVLSLTLLAALGWSGVSLLSAQEVPQPQSSPNPLSSFERLMGGQWHLDGSYQEFEWGLDKLSVKSRAYFTIGEEAQLVAEGVWYWHPKEKTIKGVFTAVEMPAVLFDYTTRFEDETMVNDLLTYDENGAETQYVETWEFSDETHFAWTLFMKTPEGLQEVMAGTYERR